MREEEVRENLSYNLRYLRTANGWSQKKVADYLHVCRSTYAYYETGKILPAYSTLLTISEIYRISTDKLLKSRLSETAQPSQQTE